MACVLMIEDDPMASQMMGDILEEMGHTIVCAATGVLACEYLRTAGFDLVMLDIGLPDTNGKILLHTIRISARHKDVPVLVVTANHSLRKADEMRLCGANGYITKPYQREVVVAQVNALLSRGRGGEDAMWI